MDILELLEPSHDAALAKRGECYCPTCEVAYHHAQQEAAEEFRKLARYSYVTKNGATHAYSTLQAAQRAQKRHNVSLPIWDALKQKEI